MSFKVDKQPVYTNGEPCYEYDFDECAGDRTTLGWIRLNPDMKSVMDRYGVDGDVNQFTKFIIAHELGHEVWDNIIGEDFKRDILSKAESENFSTAYLKTVKPSKLREETFCEYMANAVVCGDRKSEFLPINFVEKDTTSSAQHSVHKIDANYNKMVFKKVPRNELGQLLDEIETYTESKRFKREKFEQYLGSRKSIDSEDRSMYYGMFSSDGRCLALSYLNKTPAECILVAEIQCVVPGYGRLLLQDIISRSSAMWLAADPKAENTLLDYYRKFGLEEVVIDHSKWADGKEEHFFLKADGKHKESILRILENAKI